MSKEDQIDLFLYEHCGEQLGCLPPGVRLLGEVPAYKALKVGIRETFVMGQVGIGMVRILAKVLAWLAWRLGVCGDLCYTQKQIVHCLALPFLPALFRIPCRFAPAYEKHSPATSMLPTVKNDFHDHYDLALGFIDPHFILAKKVKARVKLGWLHTDFSRLQTLRWLDQAMWAGCDRIVHVSSECKATFDAAYPALVRRSIVMENILPQAVIRQRAEETLPAGEMEACAIRLLSIGRFCDAKNFDNVPDICRRILAMGLDLKWYLIGYGGDETLIRQKIQECDMEDRVILLGKKENPYPYIKACDLYVQPSRYEGKAVTVREAQILGKPVVITRFATSASQLEEGQDGVIVPMDNAGCAAGIVAVLGNPALMARLSEACLSRDYSNGQSLGTLYGL